MTDYKKINDFIKYIPASDNPLSSEVFFIKGENRTYIYDVGSHIELSDLIMGQGDVVVLSHFHMDHIGAMKNISASEIYGGKQTARYVENLRIVEESLKLDSMVEIAPIPTSHAKGCVMLNWNKEYLFIGDAYYPKEMKEGAAYNVSLLHDTIDTLKRTETEYIIISHKDKVLKKNTAIRFLENIYARHEKDSPYILLQEQKNSSF